MTLTPMLDLFAITTAVLACVTCAILGNFLVLRKQSLMGDAISHSVLPGLVAAFLLSSSRSSTVMLIGAATAGVLTVLLVELIKRVGRVEPGAAMGVVFSVFFALGVLMLEQAAARQIDLDADCVLHGMLETIVWHNAPHSWAETLSLNTLRAAPKEVTTLTAVLAAVVALVVALFKELRIASFDPALARTLGFKASWINTLLMVMVAVATVASFEAVGSILVIAMLVCPAAAARHLTDTLTTQIAWSVVLAITAALSGYIAATWIPSLLGLDALNAAGSIATISGILLGAAMLFSPKHGYIALKIRRRAVSRVIALDDLLGNLYRAEESSTPFTPDTNRPEFKRALRLELITQSYDELALTEKGRARATQFIRTHRLWEHYLVTHAGLSPDHVHDPAEQLEHTGLTPSQISPNDPHGRVIPAPPDPD